METKKFSSLEEAEKAYIELEKNASILYKELQKASSRVMLERLSFLFRSLENAKHFDKEYLSECVTEIKDIMRYRDEEAE